MKQPIWMGFLALIIVGVALVAIGIVFSPLPAKLGFINFGICAAVVGAFSWIAGAASRIKGRTGKYGVLVEIRDMDWWVWLVNFGLLAIAIIIFLAAG